MASLVFRWSTWRDSEIAETQRWLALGPIIEDRLDDQISKQRDRLADERDLTAAFSV